jgi:ribulose-5-phosphate 4-epimerase/fuculose-1-phosphate aldolase
MTDTAVPEAETAPAPEAPDTEALGITGPPTFDSVEAERLHLKQRLAATFRIFGRFGFDEGVAGHVTARDPGDPERFWVNPFGMNFKHITVSDLICVDHSGEIVEGHHPLNQAAFAIHSRVHKARPDVVAAAHAHSIYGKTWSAFRRPLEPLTQDSCAFYDDHAVFDDFTGVVLETSEGDRIAEALGHRKAAILSNHGNLTVGHSVDEAAFWFITMERTCQAQLLASASNLDPVLIDPGQAKATSEMVGSNLAGWFSFQPLWDWITREEPDLFE